MKYAGVVVLFNPDKTVIENISSYIHDIDKLYIVDNSAVSNETMFSCFDRAIYLPNYKNLGIAAALNMGAKKALEDGYDFLLTMDQDSKFDDHGVEAMISCIEKMHPNSLNAVYSPFHKTALSENEVLKGISSPLVVMTSGNIIDLKAYENVGGFKDWMFIDCVDFDFCLNLRRHGYNIIQLNDVVLNHNLGDFEKRKLFGKTYLCDNHSAFRRYYIVRNSFYICDEYGKDYPAYCQAIMGDVRYGFFIVLMFEKHKLKKLTRMIKGLFDYYFVIKKKYLQKV